MLLGELIEGIGIEPARPEQRSVRICDLTEDSRTVMPGSLFIARPGAKTDGRRYIAQALAADAAAVLTTRGADPPPNLGETAWLTTDDLALAEARLAERFYGNPSSKLTLIGVTGTNGKTTVTHLIHRMLNDARRRCGLIGTVTIDDGGRAAKASLTTPLALELSYTLAKMVEHGCRSAAIEVSSHALDQKRVAAIDFDVAAFTNLTGDHLDYHGTMEGYAAAKAILFETLKPGGCAIVNADDPAHEGMIRGCRAPVWRCTTRGLPGADCAAEAGRMTLRGTPITLTGPWGRIEGHTRLIGGFNVMNCLQAAAAAFAAGLERDHIALSLFDLAAPPGRLEQVQRGRKPESFAVFVDYAHTDDALAQALAALRPLLDGAGSRLRVVFGCGGDRDRTKRPRMARVAAELADDVIVTSDNPRTEDPHAIISEILSGVETEAAHAKMHVEADRRAAIVHAVESAQPGDILLIAGKGHEDYQLLPDGTGGIRRIDFDDRLVALEALEARFGAHATLAEGAGP
jgi:UDP-N-acetylmuramoyl-L-alanyl-D-glutamate--2,6-diaminopimelate ligase